MALHLAQLRAERFNTDCEIRNKEEELQRLRKKWQAIHEEIEAKASPVPPPRPMY